MTFWDYGIGIDLGGTTTKIGLFSSGGLLLDKMEIPTRATLGEQTVFEDIADHIHKIAEKNEIPLVVFHNGTAQRGHTVDYNPESRHIYHHFTAG